MSKKTSPAEDYALTAIIKSALHPEPEKDLENLDRAQKALEKELEQLKKQKKLLEQQMAGEQ